MKTAQEIAREWQAQMNDLSLKCPKCGNSDQLGLVWLDPTSHYQNKRDIYSCKCGCKFAACFALVRTEISKI